MAARTTRRLALVERHQLAILAVAVALFAGQLYLVGRMLSDYGRTIQRIDALAEATASIRHIDEILSMAALMAAASGDPVWEDTYERYARILDDKLATALKLDPTAKAALAQTAAANRRLVAAERQALALARSGRLAAARDLLSSTAYVRDEAAYARGMSALAAEVAEHNDTVRRDLRDRTIASVAVVTLLMALMLAALIGAFRRLGRRIDLERDLRRVSTALLACPRDDIDSVAGASLGTMASRLRADWCLLERRAPDDAGTVTHRWGSPGAPGASFEHAGAGPSEAGRTRIFSAGTAVEGGTATIVAFARRRRRPWSSADQLSVRTVVESLGAALDRRDMEEQLARLAVTDGLTGLVNRRRFAEVVQAEIERLRRSKGSAAVMMVDIDHFKQVNDSLGHAAGDAVLLHMGAIARDTLRKVDVVARVGGEEFAVVLPDCDGAEALVAAERLRRDVEERSRENGAGAGGITVSIGVTELRDADTYPDEALHRADRALYAAKRAGRNRVACDW